MGSENQEGLLGLNLPGSIRITLRLIGKSNVFLFKNKGWGRGDMPYNRETECQGELFGTLAVMNVFSL